jgi:hypothetical protein
VEWKNCTIVEMAVCILKGKGLPGIFWAEVINTVVHVLNKSLAKSIEEKPPEKI